MLVSLPDGKRTPISKIQGYMGGNFSPDGRYLAVSGYGFGGNDQCWLVYDIEQETVVGDVISDMAMIGICGNRRQLLVWHGAMRTIDLEGAATIAEQWERIRNSPIQANRLQFGNQNQTRIGGRMSPGWARRLPFTIRLPIGCCTRRRRTRFWLWIFILSGHS